jgi:eukaryotic-like serine/threonine-protein kinase
LTLSIGDRLGPYEIRGSLGAGGMGEVYRARDPGLNRDVALKVLGERFAADPDRLARFKREAQVLASLNHPHIGAIYGLADFPGGRALVLELVEGPTLADRIAAGPIPLEEALPVARQIAEALAAAHELGIVHRDLKPANVKLRPDGAVKVLDFGLAKALESGPVSGEATQSPTLTSPAMTQMGLILGTAAYMSPEQAKGRPVDKRTDVWAFGCVLFEMLTGKRVFAGDDVADTLAYVLTREPAWSLLPPETPPPIRRLLRRCLERDRARRLADVADARLEIDERESDGAAAGAGTALPARRVSTLSHWLPWAVASGALLVSMIAFGALYWPHAPAAPAAATRFLIDPPQNTELRGSFAVSPDGRRVVLRGLSEGKVLLWVRALQSVTMRPLVGTDEASSPFWSPDSRFIGFYAGGKLKKIEATGGPAQVLCDAPGDGWGGAWSADGVIIFAPREGEGLQRVSAAGGTPEALTTLDSSRGELSHFHPRFLPDGRHFLYLVISAQPENAGIRVGSLDSAETKLLVNTDASGAYAPPGYLLFLRDRTLMAQKFDADRLVIVGEPLPVADEVGRLGPGARFALFSVSRTGVLVHRSGRTDASQLTWFDRQGKQLGTVGPMASYGVPWLSPDERRVTFTGATPEGGNSDIWLMDLARGNPTRLTFDQSPDSSPVWSPDGSRILFTSERDGHPNLYQSAASGGSADELLVKSDFRKSSNDWSADGKFILYQEQNPKTGLDLWVFPLSGERKPFPFLRTPFDERQGRFSPDGRWIAYASNESGPWQVYVRSFPVSGGKWQVSTNGGAQPQWRGDGRELFYLSPDRKLMAVKVSTSGSAFDVDTPRELFVLHVMSIGLPGPRNVYAATRDGQRFLVTSVVNAQTTSPTTVVLNWTADLKQ